MLCIHINFVLIKNFQARLDLLQHFGLFEKYTVLSKLINDHTFFCDLNLLELL